MRITLKIDGIETDFEEVLPVIEPSHDQTTTPPADSTPAAETLAPKVAPFEAEEPVA